MTIQNKVISCGCGCGQTLNRYDFRGRLRKFIHGHNNKGYIPWNKGLGWKPTSAFKLGCMPWNKGKKGLQTAWNKGIIGFNAGEKNSNWKGGKSKCIVCDKLLSGYNERWCMKHRPKAKGNPASPERWKELQMKGLLKQQNSKEPTSIEKKVYNELKTRGLLFETQKLINGKFIVDAYIPSLNLIIEADGDYWHSLDRVVKKDKAENAYLTKCGYNLLRLSEHEINNGSFKERLVI